MTANPIKIEIVTSYISDVERILEAVRKLRKSNPDETLEVIIRVEKFGNCFCISIFDNFVEIIFSHTHIPPFIYSATAIACKDSLVEIENKVNRREHGTERYQNL